MKAARNMMWPFHGIINCCPSICLLWKRSCSIYMLSFIPLYKWTKSTKSWKEFRLWCKYSNYAYFWKIQFIFFQIINGYCLCQIQVKEISKWCLEFYWVALLEIINVTNWQFLVGNSSIATSWRTCIYKLEAVDY